MPISKEKFTAGPWVKRNITGLNNLQLTNKYGYIIADFSTDDTGQITPEQREANMQLTSAATDMFQFIKDLYESAQRNQAHYPELEKVYNKALGINP